MTAPCALCYNKDINSNHKVMCMSYRIGSFNVCNWSGSGHEDETANQETPSARKLNRIAEIIRTERLDIVAFQEVLSEGMMLGSLKRRLGRNWDFYWDKQKKENSFYKGDRRGEGYAFLWRTDKFELIPIGKRDKPSIWDNYNASNGTSDILNGVRLIRDPLYGRFKLKNQNFELRLITTHILSDKPAGTSAEQDGVSALDMRRNEFDILAGKIYARVADRRKDLRGVVPYTIMLGDYNLNLASSSVHRAAVPDVACFDAQGRRVEGIAHARRIIYTVQKELTSLSPWAYTNNFDHFSYDGRTRAGIIKGEARRIDAVRKFAGKNTRTDAEKFKDYYYAGSGKEAGKQLDHVPIVIEIDFK